MLICAQVQVCVQVDCFGSQEAKALLAASIARTLRLLPPPSCGREDGEAEEDMDGGARARQLPDATAMLDSKPLLDPKPGHQLSWDAEADATAQTLVALSACDHDSSLGDGGAVSSSGISSGLHPMLLSSSRRRISGGLSAIPADSPCTDAPGFAASSCDSLCVRALRALATAAGRFTSCSESSGSKLREQADERAAII